MPHCVIEYSRPLELTVSPEDLVESVYLGAVSSELFEEAAIKVRAVPYDHYRVTAGVESGMRFIHVTARILSGRNREQKRLLSSGLLKCLERFSLDNVSLTVEVVDMDREVYAKTVILCQQNLMQNIEF